MGLFDHLESAFATVTGGDFNPEEHEPNRLHELLAGGAAFAAMKQYEDRREAGGHQDHARARELLAALAGAEVDKMIETRGLDAVDAERAKRSAADQASQMYDSTYGGQAGERGGFGGERQGYGGSGEGSAGGGGYEQRRGYEGGEGGYGGGEGGYATGGGYEQRSGFEGGAGGDREGYEQRRDGGEGYRGEGYEQRRGGGQGYEGRQGYGGGY